MEYWVNTEPEKNVIQLYEAVFNENLFNWQSLAQKILLMLNECKKHVDYI